MDWVERFETARGVAVEIVMREKRSSKRKEMIWMMFGEWLLKFEAVMWMPFLFFGEMKNL